MNKVKITYTDQTVKTLPFHHLKMKSGKLQLFDENNNLISEESDIDEFEELSEAQILEQRTENFIALLNKNANETEKVSDEEAAQKRREEIRKKREQEEARKREEEAKANTIDNILRRVNEKFNEQKQESYDEDSELSEILTESLVKYNEIRQKGIRFNLTAFINYLKIHRPNLLNAISDDELIVREQIEMAICDLLRSKKISYAAFYNQEIYTLINKYKHEVRSLSRNHPENMKLALDVFKMTNAGEKRHISLIDWVVYFLKSNLGRR